MKHDLSLICVFIIWTTEIMIIIRYLLLIRSNHRIHIEIPNNETQSPINVNNNEALDISKRQSIKDIENIDLGNLEYQNSFKGNKIPKETNEESEWNITKVIDQCESNDSIEVHKPRESYLYLKPESSITQVIENSSSRMPSLLPQDINPNMEKKRRENMKKRLSIGATNINSTKNLNIIDSKNNESHINTSPRYGFRQNKSNLLDELRMKDFLKKVDNTQVIVGNKGLRFS